MVRPDLQKWALPVIAQLCVSTVHPRTRERLVVRTWTGSRHDTADTGPPLQFANARAFLPGMPSIFVDADLGVLLCRPASGSHRQWHTDQLKTEAVAQPTPNSAQSRLHSAAGIKSSYVSDSYAVPAGLATRRIISALGSSNSFICRLHLCGPKWPPTAMTYANQLNLCWYFEAIYSPRIPSLRSPL
mgnify:CR=1 FL=1